MDHATARQHDLTWLHDDPNWAVMCKNSALSTEYMLRFQAGQHPEVWETKGGVDSDTSIWGVTLLWIPEESVFWALNCGLEPAWYYSPLSRTALLRELTEWPSEARGWSDWCTELRHYRAWSATCSTCGALLTSEEWTSALYVEDGTPDKPQCDRCLAAECETFRVAQGY